MQALVTGATGLIGSRLCRHLVENGWQIRALVLPGENTDHLPKDGVEFWTGDVTDPDTLTGIAEDADVVFHLAARVLDYGSRKQFYDTIYKGTRHMLAACADTAGRFVYASSVAALGFGRHLKGLNESARCKKSGIPYNDAKTDAEDLVRAYQDRFENGCTIFRPTNVVGPRSAWVDEVGRQFVKAYLPLIDGGRHSAALIHVDNLVDGVIRAGTVPEASGETYHFRDDWAVTWKQYLTDLGAMLGKKPVGSVPFPAAWTLGKVSETLMTPIGLRPPVTRLAAGVMGRNNDVDNSKAKRELGWQTRVSYAEAMAEIRDHVGKTLKPSVTSGNPH